MFKRRITLIALLFAIVSSIVIIATSIDSSSEGMMVGEEAINLHLEDENGNLQSLEQYKGKTIILNFWASWCDICIDEMPDLISMYEHNNEKDVVIIGINRTTTEITKERAYESIEELQINFPLLFDLEDEASQMYQVVYLPKTVIIDKDFKVRNQFEGKVTEEMLASMIEEL
ncbi:putative isomerase [Bacillus sp. TS-2]|nr:putative isomerase [Bacillus sp. TS-2]